MGNTGYARKPNYTVEEPQGTYTSSQMALLFIKNYGQTVMRVHGNNARLIDHINAEYNRNLALISYEAALRDSITPILYLDIAPGEEKFVLFFMDLPTWYDMMSIVYFDFSYDGEEYEAFNSYYYGNHYSHK